MNIIVESSVQNNDFGISQGSPIEIVLT